MHIITHIFFTKIKIHFGDSYASLGVPLSAAAEAGTGSRVETFVCTSKINHWSVGVTKLHDNIVRSVCNLHTTLFSKMAAINFPDLGNCAVLEFFLCRGAWSRISKSLLKKKSPLKCQSQKKSLELANRKGQVS